MSGRERSEHLENERRRRRLSTGYPQDIHRLSTGYPQTYPQAKLRKSRENRTFL